ncbi:MAG: hypothetical protein ACI4U2_01825 [Christensenellaceae bacterium]
MANYPFLEDLDEYFCKTYDNSWRITTIPGYVVPAGLWKKPEAKDGYAPIAEELKLCYQPDRAALVERFCASYEDDGFSFSFKEIPWTDRVKNVFRKHTFRKLLVAYLKRYHIEASTFGERLALEPVVWERMCSGRYEPTKDTVFAIAVTAGMTLAECRDLLAVCGYEFSNGEVADVVVSYLLAYRISNPDMASAAMRRYGIRNVRFFAN